MNFEGLHPFEGEPKKEISPLDLKMEIQRELIKSVCAPDDDMDKCVKDWIKKNAENYGLAFDVLLSERENLAELWEKNPQMVMEAFNAEMNEMEGKRHAA